MNKTVCLCLLAGALALSACKGSGEDRSQEDPAVSQTQVNPLLQAFDTPYGVPPFDLIKPEHYRPAFEKGIEEYRADVAKVLANTDTPDYANTIEPLLNAGALLSQVSAVFFSETSANNNEALQAIEAEISPRLSALQDEVTLNGDLYAKVKAVVDRKAELALNPEQTYLMENLHQRFVQNGTALSPEDKEKLKAVNQELAGLEVAFSNNLLAESRTSNMVLEKQEDLEGLPESVVAAAAEAATAGGMAGKWLFTTDKPSMLPFLTYSPRQDLRRTLYSAYTMRGDRDNANDNKKVLAQIIKLRTRKARLLGFDTYADYVLVNRMAKNPARVQDLLMKLWTPALNRAKAELADMQKLMDQEGKGGKIEPCDWWYYAEKVRKAKYDLDDEALRPYFKLEQVMQGAFAVAGKLYGLTFTSVPDLPRPHKEAYAFDVKASDGTHMGILYMDFFPRAGKRVGAWCGGYRDSHKEQGKRVAPVVTIVCNFTRPQGDKPALLSMDEVETLFHEFGHGLDGLLAQNSTRTTYVATDFVELPSQINEHWVTEPEVLKDYARHYQTGEVIPRELVEKIGKSGQFNQGFATVEYLAASLLDMSLHALKEEQDLDIRGFEKKTLADLGLIPEILPRYRCTYFSHIVGGYSAGYYSYIWSGVLDNDAFQAFKEKGIFDQETAQSFRRNILEANGTLDPVEMYRAFRGRDAEIGPLLENRGLK